MASDTTTTRRERFATPRALTIATAALATCLATGGIAYATDLGGLREAILVWVRGQQTQAEIERLDDGAYRITYDEQGDDDDIYVYGETYDPVTGRSRPLTVDEAASELVPTSSIESGDDGRVWLYYLDQKVDITDRFDDDGHARVRLVHDGESAYFDIQREAGGEYSYNLSNGGYVDDAGMTDDDGLGAPLDERTLDGWMVTVTDALSDSE